MICNNIRKQPYKQYFLGPIHHRHVQSVMLRLFKNVRSLIHLECTVPEVLFKVGLRFIITFANDVFDLKFGKRKSTNISNE